MAQHTSFLFISEDLNLTDVKFGKKGVLTECNAHRASRAHMRNHMCIMIFCYGVRETVWKDEKYSLLFCSTSNRSLLRDGKYSIFFIR